MAKKDLSPLVIAAQQGDGQALSDLLEASYQDLYFYAYQTVKNEDLAADITQESCLEIISTLSQLREPNAFVVWARRITYHQCTRHFRESKELTVEADEDGETIFDRIPDENQGSLPEQVQLDKEFRATMQQLLDELPTQQRTALMLYYYEKLSVSQIAQIQDTTEGTVKSRLNYGRKAVKAKVEEYEKKTGTRLHSIAPLPLLLFFLFGNQSAEALASASLGTVWQTLSAGAAAGASASAGTAAVGAGTATVSAAAGSGAAAGTAAATIGVSLGAKIAAGAVAAALCIGGVVGGVALLKNSTPAEIEIPLEFCGTWYGSTYDEGDLTDCYTLCEDGTLEISGITYSINGITDFDESSAEGYPYAETFFLHFSYAGEYAHLATEGHTNLNLSYSWNNDWGAPDYQVTVYEGISDEHSAFLDGKQYTRHYGSMFTDIPLGSGGFYLDTATLCGSYCKILDDQVDESDCFSFDHAGLLQYGEKTYYLCYVRPNYTIRQSKSVFLGFTLSFSLNEEKFHSWDDSAVDLQMVNTWHGEANSWQWHAKLILPDSNGEAPAAAENTYLLVWDSSDDEEESQAPTLVEASDISMLYGQWTLVSGNEDAQYSQADTLTLSQDGTLLFAGESYYLTSAQLHVQAEPIPSEYFLYFRKNQASPNTDMQDTDPQQNADLLLICTWDTYWVSAGYFADVLFPDPDDPGSYSHHVSDPSYVIAVQP